MPIYGARRKADLEAVVRGQVPFLRARWYRQNARPRLHSTMDRGSNTTEQAVRSPIAVLQAQSVRPSGCTLPFSPNVLNTTTSSSSQHGRQWTPPPSVHAVLYMRRAPNPRGPLEVPALPTGCGPRRRGGSRAVSPAGRSGASSASHRSSSPSIATLAGVSFLATRREQLTTLA